MISATGRWIVAGLSALGALVGLVLIERGLVRSGPPADAHVTVPAALALAAAAAVGAAWPRRRNLAALTTAAVAAVSLLAALVHRAHAVPREAYWILTILAVLLLLLALTVRVSSRGEAWSAGVLATTAGTLTVLRATAPTSALDAVWVVCTWGFVAAGPVAIGLYLRALDARRARMIVAARRAQRLELAHDLHDFVAHDVTGMVVRAQAALVVASHAPAEAIAALRGIEETGLDALGSLDRTLQALRDVPGERAPAAPAPADAEATMSAARIPGVEDIFHLVGRFATTDRLPVRLRVDPVSEAQLTPEVSTTAYRVVCEALTNVRRHAPGSARVDVRVTLGTGRDSAALAVTITNRLPAQAGPARGALRDGRGAPGLGLAGLAERVAAIGGKFSAGPIEPPTGGWRVAAVLPFRGRARS